MNFFKFEDRVKHWIENNRVTWCFILLFVGLTIGILSNILLGGTSRQGTIMAFTYGFLLPIVELTTGGSGIN